MKILHLTTTLSYAGAEQIILDLAKDSKNTLIAGLKAGNRELQKRAQALDITCFNLGMKSKFDFTVLKRLRSLVEENNIDLVHTHLIHANTVGRWTLRHKSIPLVSTIHIIEKRFRPWHTWAERYCAKWAQAVVAVSPSVYEHAANQMKLPLEKLHCIPNGIDSNRFVPNKSQRDIDFLFLGRLDYQKGLDQLLPHLCEVLNSKTRFVVAGDGPQKAKWQAKATQLCLPIEWLGFVEKSEEWLPRAKVVVIPSRWEGFGLIAAEALACGCSVVHSGVDSLPSVCGDYGIRLPSKKRFWSKILIEALKNFKEDERRRQWVEKNYNRERMKEDYQKLYEKIKRVSA